MKRDEAPEVAGAHQLAQLPAVTNGARQVRPLRSYDVFDTVITRLVGLPSSAFFLVGHALVSRGLWTHTVAQFAAARVDAENRARDNSVRREVTLTEIYAELRFALPLAADVALAAAQVELQIERCLLRAVPGVNETLQRQRLAGVEVAFISDMYLSQPQVGALLQALGLMRPAERLWVSSESGHSKGEGGLFDLVARERGGSTDDWVHTGDNLWSDIQMARARGIDAVPVTDCHLTTPEQAMERYGTASGGLSSLLAGAARWTRLSVAVDATPNQRVLSDFASQVAGPAVYAFVLWVLRRAQQAGIRRVWFMARDGEVMLPIARSIAERLQLDVDIGYLYGGRQVVKVAALRAIDDKAVQWICGGAGILTIAEVLARVGVEHTEFEEVCKEFGLPTREVIGWPRMDALGRFLRDPRVSGRILAVAAQRRADVLDYFRECGLLGGERCCIVDIGWRGTVVKAIDELIGREASALHTYLYFGLYDKPVACAGLTLSAYLFDHGPDGRFGTGASLNALTAVMETFCQADHGPVMRLQRVDGEFRPVCKDETAAATTAWDVPYFQRQMATFAENVAIELCPQVDVDLRSLVAELLHHALERPTPEQARVLGGVQFIDDQAGSAAQPLAHAYRLADLRTAVNQGMRPWYGLNWWTEGAWALTSPRMKFWIRAAAKLGRLRRRRAS